MLKVAVLSDPHLGFGIGTERENDAFNNFEQALRAAIKEEPQPHVVLLCGDIFHDKIPRQEVLGKAIELFAKANKQLKTRPQILKRVKGGNTEIIKDFIPPIIAIWGTHEKRHSESTNPVQILEKAGLLYCLHAESILVECGYDKIGIHGLSGVPEPYAREALKSWNPKPFTECNNILMLHQNIKEAMPPVDYALEFADLPKDFITLCGHIHNTSRFEHPASKKPIIIVGSTVSTQLQKAEAETPKGYYVFEFGRERYDIKFVPIRTRPFFYETLTIKYQKPVEVLFEINNKISEILKSQIFIEGEKPIIRIKLGGSLAEGFKLEDLNLGRVLSEYEQKVILSVDKSSLEAIDSAQHSKILEDLRDRKLSIDDIGMGILAKNLKLNVNPEKLSAIFNLLAEEELEQAENAIEGKFESRTEPQETYVTPEQPFSQNVDEKSGSSLCSEPTVEPETEVQQSVAQEQAQPQMPAAPARSVPDPTTLHLAESGLSMLGTGSGVRSSPRPTTSRPAAAPVQQAPARRGADPETKRLAESGLSILGSSDHKAKPVIRVKEAPGANTIQKIAGQPHAKPVGQAPPPRRWRLGDDDEIIVAKKSTFNLKKFLNKDY
jgi:DNA repair exonuclease SbcCD nuclease subunit